MTGNLAFVCIPYPQDWSPYHTGFIMLRQLLKISVKIIYNLTPPEHTSDMFLL